MIMNATVNTQFLSGMDLTENTWVLIGGMRSIITAAPAKAAAMNPRVTSTNFTVLALLGPALPHRWH
jgi:hypothetical protein